jgi:manganese transport protein
VTIAAAVFHGRGIGRIQSLDQAFTGLRVQLGNGADILFGLGLLASGLSSCSVGTLAGQVVMQGFIRRQIPLFLRRSITMAPALLVIAIGLDPTRALVFSQVVLSFGIPSL